MKCQNCNANNEDNAKFCIHCGSSLERQPVKAKKPLMTRKQLIFTLIAVIGIIAVGAAIHYSNILMGEPQLVSHDFQAVTMSVPEGSNFVLTDQMTQNTQNGFIAFMNKGDYGYRFSGIFITQKADRDLLFGNIIEDNGDTKVSENTSDGYTIYQLQISKPDYLIVLTGGDLNLLKKMAETIEVKDMSVIQPQTTSVNV